MLNITPADLSSHKEVQQFIFLKYPYQLIRPYLQPGWTISIISPTPSFTSS